jgi:hypothetical protein
MRDRNVAIDRIAVTDKKTITHSRNGLIVSYIVCAGKLEYHFPKEVFERINIGDELTIETAEHSGEIISAKSSSGENYPLI